MLLVNSILSAAIQRVPSPQGLLIKTRKRTHLRNTWLLSICLGILASQGAARATTRVLNDLRGTVYDSIPENMATLLIRSIETQSLIRPKIKLPTGPGAPSTVKLSALIQGNLQNAHLAALTQSLLALREIGLSGFERNADFTLEEIYFGSSTGIAFRGPSAPMRALSRRHDMCQDPEFLSRREHKNPTQKLFRYTGRQADQPGVHVGIDFSSDHHQIHWDLHNPAFGRIPFLEYCAYEPQAIAHHLEDIRSSTTWFPEPMVSHFYTRYIQERVSQALLNERFLHVPDPVFVDLQRQSEQRLQALQEYETGETLFALDPILFFEINASSQLAAFQVHQRASRLIWERFFSHLILRAAETHNQPLESRLKKARDDFRATKILANFNTAIDAYYLDFQLRARQQQINEH